MLPQTSSGRWLAGITAGVVALMIVAVGVTLVADSGDPTPLPQGSPEAAVQAFVQAIDDGGFAAGYDMLHPDLRATCDEIDFRAKTVRGSDTDMRVSLANVDTFEDTAYVTVNIRSFSGSPPFDFSENSYEVHFVLKQTDDGWRIFENSWPFGGCFRVPLKLPPTPVPTVTPTTKPATSS